MLQEQAHRERRNLVVAAERHTGFARYYKHSATVKRHRESVDYMDTRTAERHSHPAFHIEQALAARKDWDWRKAHTVAHPDL